MTDTAPRRPVLITRTAPGASETAGRLQQLGLHPVVAPVLGLAARDVPLPALSAYEGLIFTSANGVRFLAEATPDRALTAWCVGPATASEAIREGFSPVHQSSGDAGDLAHFIAHHWHTGRPRRLLHIANSAAKGIVKQALGAEGFEVDFLPLYETRTAPSLSGDAEALLTGGEPFIILIHSAKGASALLALAGHRLARDQIFVAISSQAATPLAEKGFQNVTLADHPDEDHLIAALQRVLASG